MEFTSRQPPSGVLNKLINDEIPTELINEDDDEDLAGLYNYSHRAYMESLSARQSCKDGGVRESKITPEEFAIP